MSHDMILRSSSVRTQGGRQLKNIKIDFKFSLTRKQLSTKIFQIHKLDKLTIVQKKNTSSLPVNFHQVMHLSFQALIFLKRCDVRIKLGFDGKAVETALVTERIANVFT